MKFAVITFKPLLHLAFAWSRPVATEHVLWPRNIFSAATTCLIAMTWLANVQPRAKQDKSQIRTQRMISKIKRHAVLRFDHMPKLQKHAAASESPLAIQLAIQAAFGKHCVAHG